MIVTIIVAAAWITAAVAICWSNHRARQAAPTPPPPPDPDATADDYDTDRVERITSLPPVPLPDRWTDADEAMLAWFCAGGAGR